VSEFEHTQIVREMFDAWNSHDVARYSTVLHAACTVEWTTRRQSARGDLVGSETASAAMRRWLSVFPDLHFDVEATASSGGRVVASWRATATRAGGGLETGGCSVVAIQGERIVNVWSYWDSDRMLRHLSESLQRGSDRDVSAHRVSAAS
jgi:ketosteroid isomerase-like protein